MAALVDLIDQDSDVPALIGRLMASEDPREVLELAVRIPRSVVDSSGDLIVALAGAAPTDEAAAAALAEGRRRHDTGMARSIERLAELGALRDGTDTAEAAAAAAALTSDETFALLTERHGWDLDACERWMRETLARSTCVRLAAWPARSRTPPTRPSWSAAGEASPPSWSTRRSRASSG